MRRKRGMGSVGFVMSLQPCADLRNAGTDVLAGGEAERRIER